MTAALSIKHRKKSALVAGLLAALAIVCYLPSLSNGFLSDDGAQYTYIYNYLHTQPLMLLQNFASCWMQEPLWGLHYRPMMLLPLIFDVVVWNQNTIGWHITCLFIHASCTVLVYLLSRKVLKNLSGLNGIAIPVLAGALFAAHPLHAESVTWICGRVDSVCALFYLSSFVTFMLSLESDAKRSLKMRVLSQCLCVAALLSKEVGVTLPSLLTWYTFCLNLRSFPWKKAALSAIKTTRIYWLLFALYYVARSLALGTFYGGYHGFGSVVLDTIWLPGLLDWRLLQGVFFPVPLPQLDELKAVLQILVGLHVTMLVGCIARFAIVRDWAIWRAAVFLTGWLLMCFSLVARVWYAASGLPGGRHFYLVSVPFLLLSVLLLVPTTTKDLAQRKLKNLSIGLVSIYCLLLAALTIKGNELWFAAHSHEAALETAICDLYKKNPKADRLVFLNPAATFDHLASYPTFVNLQGCLRPPLFSPDLQQKIATLRAHIFNLDLINKSAFAANLSRPNTIVFGWNANKRELGVVPQNYFPSADGNAAIPPKNVALILVSKDSKSATYEFPADPSFDKGAYDCLEITTKIAFKSSQEMIDPTMLLSWNHDVTSRNNGLLSMYRSPEGNRSVWRVDQTDGLASALSCYMEADGRTHKYRFHLSELASWILFGKLSDLRLSVAPISTEIQSVRFLNLDNEIPKLSASPELWTREQNGTLVSKSKDSLVLNFDATKISGADHVMVEISKPFEYFEYFNPTYRQDVLSAGAMKKYSLEGLKGNIELWRDDFKVPGEYDVRIAAFDKEGKLLGYVSDSLTIRI